MTDHELDHHHHHEVGGESGVGTERTAASARPHDHGPDSHAGHDKHVGHSVAMFRDRFWLSLLLTLPIVFFSEMIQEWFGYTAPTFPGSDGPGLGTVIFFYGGSPT
jgi:Cu2+-exporting ATPase